MSIKSLPERPSQGKTSSGVCFQVCVIGRFLERLFTVPYSVRQPVWVIGLGVVRGPAFAFDAFCPSSSS